MSSSFDITQQALQWLAGQVEPNNRQAKEAIFYLERIVDKWHDVHHSGIEALNQVAYQESQLLLTVLKYNDDSERQEWLKAKGG